MKKIMLPLLAVVLFAARLSAQTVSTIPSTDAFEPYGVAVDLATNAYYFTDSANNRVLKYDNGTASQVTIVEGTPVSGDLFSPAGIVYAPTRANGLVVADSGHHRIVRVDPVTTVITTIAGSVVGNPGNSNAVGTTALFNNPTGVAIDTNGIIYVADSFNNAIRTIDTGDAVKTLATGFSKPDGVAVGGIVAGARQIWVGDTLHHVIQLLEVTNNVLKSATIIAGQSGSSGSGDSLNATNARFNHPRGMVWVGGQTGLLISDSDNNTIRRLYFNTPQNRYSVETYAGSPPPTVPSLTDGTPSAARFFSPVGITKDADFSIVIADLKNDVLRKFARVALPTPTTTLVAGTTTAGGSFSNGVTVVFTSSQTNVTFYYTTNGIPPLLSSDSGPSVFLNGGPVSNAVPLQFRGFSPDFNASAIVSNYYTFFVAPPLISPTGITNNNDFYSLIVSNVTTNADLYYTTDGSEPINGSLLHIGSAISNLLPITNNNLKIKGFLTNYADSATATFTFNLTVADPVIIPAGATNNNPVSFIITNATTNAVIYYTTDGTDPATNGVTSRQLTLTNVSGFISANLLITNTGTLKIRGFKRGYIPSAIVSANVALIVGTPFVTAVPSFTNNNTISITMTNATTNGAIKMVWTVDGSEPQLILNVFTNGTVYTSPFILADTGSNVFKAKGFLTGYQDSVTASKGINLFVSTPVISPPGATNNNNVAFTIFDATTNSVVYATTDGTDPDQSSQLVVNLNPANTNFVGTIIVTNNGTLKVKGFRNGFNSSGIASATVNLRVATPVITAVPGFTNNNDIAITITCATTNTSKTIVVTTDGSDPVYTQFQTNGYIYSGTFTLATNGTGTIKAGAFLNGYQDSAITNKSVNLFVSDPILSPAGATNNNDTYVTVTELTTNAHVYYSLNGIDPTTTNNEVIINPVSLTGTIQVSTNGTLKVKGFRDGYNSSQVVSGNINLSVATPIFSKAAGTYIDGVTNVVSSATTNSALTIYYTLDGTTPTIASQSTTNNHPFIIKTNTTLSVLGVLGGYLSSPVVSSNYLIKVATPLMSPSGGYFPSGTVVTFANGPEAVNHLISPGVDATIYYTIDGSVPTTNGTLYAGSIPIDQVSFPDSDLRLLNARAFAPNCLPSDIVAGQSFPTNVVGVPQDLVAGVGSTIVVPVIANLKTNVDLRSLQFRMEITTNGGAPIVTSDMIPLNVSTNDFVPIVANFDGSANNFTVVTYHTPAPGNQTNGIRYSSIATNLFIRDFGLIVNTYITIPSTAVEGQKYTIRILEVSGTSDGAQATIPLSPLANRTVTVTNVHYLVGDTAPGRWYNAGDFGTGGNGGIANLENADVNNVFRASLGFHTPYQASDAFNAMDVYPLDSAGIVGGDGQIRFLDWQILLDRAVRRTTNNWYRFWSAGGVLANSASGPLPASALGPVHKSKTPLSPPGLVWFRQVQIGAGALGNVVPGNTYDVPVYANVLSGYNVAGLQFRASLKTDNGAPAVSQPLSFIPAAGLPDYVQSFGTDVVCGWSLANPFNPSLQGSNFLGYVRCQIPAGGQSGQTYSLHFSYCDGAPDYNTQYDFESFPATVALFGSPVSAATISDEWKLKFFGSLTSAQAGANADPDGDGVSNLHEYLAGTNPTNSASHLQFSGSTWSGNGNTRTLALNWLTAPGKNYSLESSSSVNGGWSTLISDIAGDGYTRQIVLTNDVNTIRFYRVRLQP